jgi:hypothetical protein
LGGLGIAERGFEVVLIGTVNLAGAWGVVLAACGLVGVALELESEVKVAEEKGKEYEAGDGAEDEHDYLRGGG